eukprot:2803088-Rhodomonas_salina.2
MLTLPPFVLIVPPFMPALPVDIASIHASIAAIPAVPSELTCAVAGCSLSVPTHVDVSRGSALPSWFVLD